MLKATRAATLAAGALMASITPAQAQTDTRLIGEIITFGGNFCPRDTLPADGRLVNISDHYALFSLYGTMFGGDARTTFGLPDMRGVTTSDGRELRHCVVVMGTFPSRS